MYRIETQPVGRLHVTVTGLMSDADADAYITDLTLHAAKMRKAHGCARVLVDGRESAIQSVQVMAKMADIQSVLIVNERDRAAYVVRSALGKMQAQRLSTTNQLNVFLTPEEALAWLNAAQT